MFPIFSNQKLKLSFYTTENITVTVRGQVRINAGRKCEEIVVLNEQYALSGVTSGAVSTFTKEKNIPSGELLNISLSLSTSGIQRGQSFVKGDIIDSDGLVTVSLFSDYITSKNAVGYPFSKAVSSLSGVGYRTRIDGVMQGGGTSWNIPLDENCFYHAVGLYTDFVTDATVANRKLGFVFTFDNNVTHLVNIAYTFTASKYYYIYLNSLAVNEVDMVDVNSEDQFSGSLPSNLKGYGSGSLSVISKSGENVQAGDLFSQSAVVVEQWIKA